METYFRTQEETKEAAKQAKVENFNTHLFTGSTQCECGESLSFTLRDDFTLIHLETFVYCEHCANHYN